MKSKLSIKNFGPIKDAEIDLRQTTVFIGPQASGKSTIAKLAYICNLEIEGNTHLRSLEGRDFESYFPFNFWKENVTKIYFIKHSLPGLQEKGYIRITGIYDTFLSQSETNRYHGVLLIPAERTFISIASGSFISLVNNKVPIPKTILEFGSAFEKARNSVDSLNIDFLNIQYKYENAEDRIYFGDNKEDFVKLRQSSSGQQNVVPMLMVVENNYQLIDEKGFTGGATFIIEEPELNLYPKAQKDLTYHLVNRCVRKREEGEYNDLILTTHSPYILTALNNLLFAFKVAERHPEKKAEIAKIIPKESWLNPDDFNAYFVANGTVEQIFNRETGMISENELDSGSDEILEDFDALMEIYKLPAHA